MYNCIAIYMYMYMCIPAITLNTTMVYDGLMKNAAKNRHHLFAIIPVQIQCIATCTYMYTCMPAITSNKLKGCLFGHLHQNSGCKMYVNTTIYYIITVMIDALEVTWYLPQVTWYLPWISCDPRLDQTSWIELHKFKRHSTTTFLHIIKCDQICKKRTCILTERI